MTTKTLPATGTTIAAVLGNPQPAGAAKRQAAPAAKPKTPSGTIRFEQWKQDITAAREAVNYSDTSPIYGMTDIEVVTQLRISLEDTRAKGVADGSFTEQSTLNTTLAEAVAILEELLKRKLAKQVAGQAYKASKNS